MAQRVPGALLSLSSDVGSTTPRSSASATYTASKIVMLCRSSQHRGSSGAARYPPDRQGMQLPRARSARRTLSMPAATCRRRTLATSRSSSSGAVRSWPRSAALASWPSAESSASAGARMMASTTITVLPDQCRGGDQRHPATPMSTGPVQHLINGRDGRLMDQTRQKVLLQGLMRSSRSGPEHRVRVIRYVFDLHARHGATLAPQLAFAQGLAHQRTITHRDVQHERPAVAGGDRTGPRTGSCRLPGTPAFKRVMVSAGLPTRAGPGIAGPRPGRLRGPAGPGRRPALRRSGGPAAAGPAPKLRRSVRPQPPPVQPRRQALRPRRSGRRHGPRETQTQQPAWPPKHDAGTRRSTTSGCDRP